MKWVLIVFAIGSGGAPALTSAEFEDARMCDVAGKVISRRLTGLTQGGYECVPTASPPTAAEIAAATAKADQQKRADKVKAEEERARLFGPEGCALVIDPLLSQWTGKKLTAETQIPLAIRDKVKTCLNYVPLTDYQRNMAEVTGLRGVVPRD